MVWGAISSTGTVILRRCTNNMDSTEYQGHLKELIKAAPRLRSRANTHLTLMHDGARCHTSAATERWLLARNVRVLPWCANSPDLNPIENLWGLIARSCRGKLFPNEDAVWDEVKRLWDELTPAQVKPFTDSMHRRLEAVRRAKGGATRY